MTKKEQMQVARFTARVSAFERLVHTMRQLQTRYFKDRTKQNLLIAKGAEAEIDEIIENRWLWSMESSTPTKQEE